MDLKKLQNGSDIRGIAIGEGANLTEGAAKALAAAFYEWLKARKKGGMLKVAIGRDSRVSGPALLNACAEALAGAGAEVIDCGLCSTPAMFMTTVTDGFMADGAIMVTASHLPMDRNGLKFFTARGGLEKSDIAELIATAEKGAATPAAQRGSVAQRDFIPTYAAILRDKIVKATGEQKPFAGCKIIVDAGNGAGGFYASRVLEPLGADTGGSQFLEPDGTFPNHIPNPENEEAMDSIRDAVIKSGADFGVIFDTDVDRAGAVDVGGAEIGRNRLIAVISAILLKEFPGTTIVTDSVTSSGLAEFIAACGGVHHRFKRGYKNVIDESIRLNESGTDSQLAIETSGHAAFKENYFLDDGAYLITRILIAMAQLKKRGKTISGLISTLKEPAESREIRLNIKEDDFKAYGEKLIASLNDYAKARPGWRIASDNYEGIRVSFDKGEGDGWFLLRLSLHDPLIPINVESDSIGGAKIIMEKLYGFLKDKDGIGLAPLTAAMEAG